MTILTVLILTVVSMSLAQPVADNTKERSTRASQSAIAYNGPDGTKTNWRSGTKNQWKSQLEPPKRVQRAEAGTGHQKQAPVIHQAPVEVQPSYQPFSSVPNHIKQLLISSYTPQGTYVDPGAFLYNHAPAPAASLAPETKDEAQPVYSPMHRQLQQDYFNSAVNYRAAGYQENDDQSGSQLIGRVPPRGSNKYKDEERLTQRSAASQYGPVMDNSAGGKAQYQPHKRLSQSYLPQYNKQDSQSKSQYRQSNGRESQPQSQTHYATSAPQEYNQEYKEIASPVRPVSETNYEKNMPMAIQTLLHYQAQLPYNVIANHIFYRPKQLFVPKPLPESIKLSKQYPTKIYFLKTDGEIYDSPETSDHEQMNNKRY